METNFKVDVPSFALGYSAGKKKGGSGGGSGGGESIDLNIHYSKNAPPEDTSKLWLKTSKPRRVIVSENTNIYAPYQFKNENASVTTAAKANPAFGVYDNKIYCFGGNTGTGSNRKLMNTITCYDIDGKFDTTLPVTFPVNIYCAASAQNGSYIYIFGGSTSANTVASFSKNIYKFNADYDENPTLELLAETINHNNYYFTAFDRAGESKGYIFCKDSQHSDTGKLYCFDATTEKTSLVSENCSATAIGFTSRSKRGLYDGGQYLYGFGNFNIIKTNISTLKSEIIGEMPMDISEAPSCAMLRDYILFSSGEFDYGSVTSNRHGMFVVDLKTGIKERITDSEQYEVFGHKDGVFGNTLVPAGDKIYILPGFYGSSMSSTYSIGAVLSFVPPVADFELDADTVVIVPSKNINTFKAIDSDIIKFDLGMGRAYRGNAEGKAEEIEAALYKDGEWVTI